jgi:SOS response regulatory protein OraA/RecX
MPEITGLRETPAGVVVELDGEPWRTIPTAAAARAGLALGKQLGRQELRRLRHELRRAEALRTAAAVLHRRPYSKSSLEHRLERRGVAPAARAAAMEALERAGYVDDDSYARTRALGLAGRGYGDGAIRFTLEREGVPEAAREAAIESLAPELVRAEEQLAQAESVQRGLTRLARRGFSQETVEELAAR